MLNGTLCFILAVKPSTVGFFFHMQKKIYLHFDCKIKLLVSVQW